MIKFPLPQGSGGGGSGTIEGLNASAAELNTLDKSACGAIRKFQKAAITRHADTDPHTITFSIPAGSHRTGAYLSVKTPESTASNKRVDILVGDIEGNTLFGSPVDIVTSYMDDIVIRGSMDALDELTFVYLLGSADFTTLVADLIIEYIEFA